MNDSKKYGIELSDEELMELTGGQSFVNSTAAVQISSAIILMYGIAPILKIWKKLVL